MSHLTDRVAASLIAAFLVAAPAALADEVARYLAPTPSHEACGHGKAAWLLRGDTPTDDRGFDVQHYVLEVIANVNHVDGHCTIELEPTVDGLTEVVLDLWDTYTVDVVSSGTHGVAGTSRGDNFLTVTLDTPADPGETVEVQVFYEGTPPDVGGPVATPPFVWSEHGTDEDGTLAPVAFTLSVPNRSGTWWPCKEDLEDKATIDVSVTTPSPELVGVSNGLFLGYTEAGGLRTYHWTHSYPVVPYLVSLAISNYELITETVTLDVDGGDVFVPLDVYAYPEHADQVATDFARMPDAIRFFSDAFGPYPFRDERLGYAIVDWSGGMEHQTQISLGSRFIKGTGADENIFVHELAHQWFGDHIALRDLRDMWLNEGFATYCEALWFEEADGPEAYFARMRALDPFAPPQGSGFRGTVWDPAPLYGTTPYNMGAWILHMLRWVVGDDAFREILPTYVTEREVDGNTSTEEFVAVCEDVSGMELDGFFDQWLYAEGRPNYAMRWSASPGTGGEYDVVVDVQQQQNGAVPVYVMPLELVVETGAGADTVVVQNDERNQRFTFSVVGEPTSVELDPGFRVLRNRPLASFQIPEAAAVLRTIRPNPMLASTRFEFTVYEDSPVRLRIYDVHGRLVRTLIDDVRDPREHSVVWDGRDDAGHRLGAGAYYAELEADGRTESRRVVKVD